MRSYKDVISELENNGIYAQKEDFYDYSGFPLEAEFELFLNIVRST